MCQVKATHSCDQPLIKTLGTGSLISFFAWRLFTRCLTPLLGELSSPRVILLGEDSWKLVPGFPWTSPYVPLLYADFALYLSAVVNRGHKHNYLLKPVSPTRKSSNLEVVLRTPCHIM